MPSTLSWVFDMGNDYGVARSGSRQHIFPGDQVQNVAKDETATMEIVKIFHQLAGEGRYAHRPALRPIYDYEVGFSAQARADRREAESSTAPAPAQAPAPAAM